MKAYFRKAGDVVFHKDGPAPTWVIDFLNQAPGLDEHHEGSMSLVHLAKVIQMVKGLLPTQQVMVSNNNGDLRGRIVTIGDRMGYQDQLQMYRGETFEARQLVEEFDDIYKPDLTHGATKVEFNVQPHMQAIAKALQNDPDYAWSWYCNLKMMIVDSGVQYRLAALAASRQLQMIFELDITKHSRYADDLEHSFQKDLSWKVTHIAGQEFSEPEIMTFEALIQGTAYNDTHLVGFPKHDKVTLDRLVSLGFAKYRPKDGKYIDEGYKVTDSGLECFFAARLSHHSYLKVPATELTSPGMASIKRAQEHAKVQAVDQHLPVGFGMKLNKHLVRALSFILAAPEHKLSLKDLNHGLLVQGFEMVVERVMFPLVESALVTVYLVDDHHVGYELTPKGVNVATWLTTHQPVPRYDYVEVPALACWSVDGATDESQVGESALAFADEFLAAADTVLRVQKHEVQFLSTLLRNPGCSLAEANVIMIAAGVGAMSGADVNKLIGSELVELREATDGSTTLLHYLSAKGRGLVQWLQAGRIPTQDYAYIEVPIAEESEQEEAAEVDNRPSETRNPSMAQVVFLRAMRRTVRITGDSCKPASWSDIAEWVTIESSHRAGYLIDTIELAQLEAWGLITIKRIDDLNVTQLTETGLRACKQLNNGPLNLNSREYQIPALTKATWFDVPANMKSASPQEHDVYGTMMRGVLDLFVHLPLGNMLSRENLLKKLESTGWPEEVIRNTVRQLVMHGYLIADWTQDEDQYGFTKAGLQMYVENISRMASVRLSSSRTYGGPASLGKTEES